MVALVAEGCAVVARAPALLWDVQIPLAVEGDPVLRPRRLVAPLARHLIKGSRWYLLHCLATQDSTPEIYVIMRTFYAVVKCHYVPRLEVSLCKESLAGYRGGQRRLSHLHPRSLVLVAKHRLSRHYPEQRIVSLNFSTPKNQLNI